MTQIFKEDGTVVPVTAVEAGPCFVIQKKDIKNDGYVAVKCVYGEKKKANKSLLGMFKKVGDTKFRYIREFRMKEDDVMVDKISEGDQITLDAFVVGDVIAVQGTSKGKGFQGVVKRHGFKGGKASHGHKDQLRMPGSIGCTGPARVFKGMKMGGRMGGLNSTVTNLEIVEVDAEKNILYVLGAVPGCSNGLLKIWGNGEFEIKATKLQNAADTTKVITEDKKEEIKEEVATDQQDTTEVKVEEKKEEVKVVAEKKEEVSADAKAMADKKKEEK